MLTIVNKLFTMNVIMLSVVMLCVVAPLIIQVPPPLCWEGSKHFLQIFDIIDGFYSVKYKTAFLKKHKITMMFSTWLGKLPALPAEKKLR
jgi:hypothetical protein